ncbi:MAG: hypothetical protein ACK40U_09290 [Fervidobacterium pennivorans]
MSCSSSKKATVDTTVARILPTFDYAVQKSAGVGTSDITIALVNPTYVSQNAAYALSPFNIMAKAMGNDFEELLTAKGFKIRGPFDGMGSMLFSDKKNSDFIFAVEIALNQTGTSQYKQKRKIDWGAAIGGATDAGIYSYTYTGKGTIGGTLTITALSPSFGEKLWKKNIELRQVPYEFVGSIPWSNTQATFYDHLQQDPVVHNVLVKQIERMYVETFKLIESQIDVEEMKTVAAEAKKAEKKN